MDLEAIKAKAKENSEKSTGDFPPWLSFEEEGQEFLGIISEIRDNPWEEGQHLYEVVGVGEDEETYTLKSHRALVSQIVAQKAQIGDYIYIKYLGMAKSTESKQKYNAYEVGIVKPDEVEA
jgi:hypothetical protein